MTTPRGTAFVLPKPVVGHMPGEFGTVLSAGAYPVEIALVVIAVHLCLYDSGGPDDERVMG